MSGTATQVPDFDLQIDPEVNESLGQMVIDQIIEGGLLNIHEADDGENDVVIAWAANAAEQIGQQVRGLINQILDARGVT